MDKFKELTEILRRKRNFNPSLYIKMKIDLINAFFEDNKLDSVIVGVSGGIDSAVVLSLLSLASEEIGSPIKRILALSLPIYTHGTSGQADSVYRAHSLFKLIKNQKVVSQIVDLTDVAKEYEKAAKKINVLNPTPWSIGQMCSIVRTPFLYFQAAILQEIGYKSIVCGTINRDEGSYIGFYGKASDAMVDLQIIADIHKSEVYHIAKLLDIPPEIITVQPKGDVWDGKIDIDMIGATYDFLETYTLFMSENSNMTKEFLDKSFLEYCINHSYQKMKENVDNLHKINKHKYEVGMPSHFLDIMKRKI